MWEKACRVSAMLAIYDKRREKRKKERRKEKDPCVYDRVGSREKVGHGIGALHQKWGYRPPENWKRKEVVTYWRLLLQNDFLVIVLALTLRRDLEPGGERDNVISDWRSGPVEMH